MPILTVRYTPGFVSERNLLTAMRELNRTLSEVLSTDFATFKGFLIPVAGQVFGEEGSVIYSQERALGGRSFPLISRPNDSNEDAQNMSKSSSGMFESVLKKEREETQKLLSKVEEHTPSWLTKIFGNRARKTLSYEHEKSDAERIFMLHITLEMLPGKSDIEKLNAHRAMSKKVEELLQATKVAQKAVVTLYIYEFSGIFSANVINLPKGEM